MIVRENDMRENEESNENNENSENNIEKKKI